MRAKKPGRSSIREALDTLPVGVCYFTQNGMVRLCNRQMHRLYRVLAQRDLQTLDELRDALGACGAEGAVKRLPDGTYRFPDGRVWRYCERPLQAADGRRYTEALFYNVTELYEKRRELETQIGQLQQFSGHLRARSENVAAAVREQELLTAKTQLHASMSGNLTVLRQTMAVPGARQAQEAAVQAMRQTVCSLLSGGMVEDIDFSEFLQTAARSGVTVTLTGTLPAQKKIRAVFMIAMRECLTNCICHAQASELCVAFTAQRSCVVCRITNNGLPPREEITPRGGLQNLRRHVENCGGTMEICSTPAFLLTITLPVEEETL